MDKKNLLVIGIIVLLTAVLGFGVTVAFFMLVYALTFFTISPSGLRILITSVLLQPLLIQLLARALL